MHMYTCSAMHTNTNRAGNREATSWAEARIKIARMTLTIKLDGNWSSFQLANSAPPLSVTDSAIAPSARMPQDAKLVRLRSGIVLTGEFFNVLERGASVERNVQQAL